MNRRIVTFLFLLLSLSFFAPNLKSQEGTAAKQPVAPVQQAALDLILFDGKVFTSDVAHPYVQALAIRGERIVATGDTDKIMALAGPQTKKIDLGDRTVVPGINDAHNHVEVSDDVLFSHGTSGSSPPT